MAIQVGKRANRNVKPKMLEVISICSVCQEPVRATTKDKAFRHGYKRYRRQMNQAPNTFKRFSQEDDKSCAGSGREVIYKRFKK